MGLGFNLLFVLVLVPLTLVLLWCWLGAKKMIFGKILGGLWLGVVAIIVLSFSIQYFTSKIELTKDDFYGSYVVDGSMFPGRQSDWQYDHFRFVIDRNDSIRFYVTNKQAVLRIYKGSVSAVTSYRSARLAIRMEQPTHPILQSNPTIYRSHSAFILVFASGIYGNMFFTKGK